VPLITVDITGAAIRVNVIASWRRDFPQLRTSTGASTSIYRDEKYPDRRDLRRASGEGEACLGAPKIPDGLLLPFPSALDRDNGNEQSCHQLRNPCQLAAAVVPYSSTGRASTTDYDAALDLIPEQFVNERCRNALRRRSAVSAVRQGLRAVALLRYLCCSNPVCRTAARRRPSADNGARRHGLPLLGINGLRRISGPVSASGVPTHDKGNPSHRNLK